MTGLVLLRSTIFAAVALCFAALAAAPASAGVATSGAVLLDPFDPVPEIQFRHYGGYGCVYACGAPCESGCYDACHDGCRRHVRHDDCNDACGRRARNDCDDGCGRRAHNDCDRDCNRGASAPPVCTSGHCYDADSYERRWRDGDRVGLEWGTHGWRERKLDANAPADPWYNAGEAKWHSEEGAPTTTTQPTNSTTPPAPATDNHSTTGICIIAIYCH